MKKLRSFYFGRFQNRKKARLFFKIKHSNIQLTMTDIHAKVVVCRTPASCGLEGTKRRKKAPHSVEYLVQGILFFVRIFDIRFIHLFIRNKSSKHVHFLLKELAFYDLRVFLVTLLKKKSHNGSRGKKLRRR